MEDEYEFKYITFDNLDSLKEFHPLVYDLVNDEKIDFNPIKDCPDMDKDFPCFFYLKDRKKNRIVAYNLCLPDIFITREKYEHKWGWTGNLYTEPEYRGRGFASLLTKEGVKLLHSRNISRASVFMIEPVLQMLLKIGYKTPGYAKRFLFFKTLRPFLKEHIKISLIVYIMDIIYLGIFSILKLIFKIQNRQKIKAIKINNENGRYEEIFNKIKYFNKYHFNNSLKKIRWKMAKKNIDELYIIMKKATEIASCYIVVRNRMMKKALADKYKEFKLMTLMDYGYFEEAENVKKDLINAVIEIFIGSDAEVLEIITSCPELCKYAKKMGMIKIGKGMPFAFSIPETWNIGNEYGEITNWHLTHFCGDGSRFD